MNGQKRSLFPVEHPTLLPRRVAQTVQLLLVFNTGRPDPSAFSLSICISDPPTFFKPSVDTTPLVPLVRPLDLLIPSCLFFLHFFAGLPCITNYNS
jgi:hypothetical protein